MSAERGTTYHLDSWEALVAEKKKEKDPKGPYHLTYDSVRVQANKLYRTMSPEEDRAAQKRKLNELRAELYMNNKKDKESGASRSRSMATIVSSNNNNNYTNNNKTTTTLIEVVDNALVPATEVGVQPTRLTFRERCDQLLGMLWWDKVDETLLPRADDRRELCRSMLRIVERGGMGSPSEPGYAMTLLLYWCQQTINHQVGPIIALSREQLRHNCELIYRALGVTGRSVYVPPFLQPHTYQILGKFSEQGAAVFGLIWLFRDHWPMSRVPSCGSMADVQLHTLTKYVMPLVTSCVERRATEQEWLLELCRLSVRLSPQHLEYAGTFHTDEGDVIGIRDTAFGRQLEAHVYAHVTNEKARYGLFKYIDEQALYLAHVQSKLQQQAELRSVVAEQTAQRIVDEHENRQWLHDSMESLRRQLANPTLRKRAREMVAGLDLKLLGRYNAPPDSFKKRGVPSGSSEQWSKGSLTLYLGGFPQEDRSVRKQHWNILRDHAFTTEDQQCFRLERRQQRQLRRRLRIKNGQRLRQRQDIADRWAEVNDVWQLEPSTPPFIPSKPHEYDEDEECSDDFDVWRYCVNTDDEVDEKSSSRSLYPDQRFYHQALWQRHVVNPVSDHRLSPPPHAETTPTLWTTFRDNVVQLNKQENSLLEYYLRNEVQSAPPCSSDEDVDNSKEPSERLPEVGELEAPMPTSSIAPWTLRSTAGLLECVLHKEDVSQQA